jgi:hypothetical protein
MSTMEGNSKYNEVIVGADGAIYCMVKPPVYDVDTRTVEQGNFLTRAPIPGHSSARVRNLAAVNPGIRNIPGAILPASLNTGSLSAFNPNMLFPGVGDGAVIQPQMSLLPEMSLSSICGFNTTASGNTGLVLSAIGDMNTTTTLTQPNFVNAPVMQATGQDGLLARNRRRLDDLDVSFQSDIPNKRMRLTPLTAGQGFSTGRVDPTLGARCFSLYNDTDERNISQYQCLARKQIEIFESTPDDACSNAQGRNRPINPGQVGIRCRHCKKSPPKQRKTGSVYYPNRVRDIEE